MRIIEASEADITRNERGEVVVSLALPEPSGIAGEADLFLQRRPDGWRAAVRDPATGTTVSLPALADAGAEWLTRAPPFAPGAGQMPAVPGDPRRPGVRYALVCEVVGASLAGGYAARVQVLGAWPEEASAFSGASAPARPHR